MDEEVRMSKKLVFAVVVALALACWGAPLAAQASAPTSAQDKPEDMKKLIADIAGEYSFEVQGQALVVQFFVQDGKLYGAPPGETPEEIRPVEGRPRCFEVTVSDGGEYFFLEFVRNDKGVIEKCLLTVQGQVVEGAKIIK
jgi:hypothetical protein